MVHVIATIEVVEGKRDEFVSIFNDNLSNVLAEDGCLAYGPMVDLDTGFAVQIPVRENVVTIVEQWESLDHLKAHLVASHMATYREQVKDLVLGVSLQVLEPA
ncbi:MAG: putative quinol monooxygenase [Candidatus Latescibacteria bacterium]|jgi:quinol monooxygenase YgiN|nr:putative quinol monooxygenase [Candidatus Latescibacterota bacterium]